MKNNKEISSLKGLRINGQSYLLQTSCPYRDGQESTYQKAFLTAKSARKSQRSQRGNHPLQKCRLHYAPLLFFAVTLNDQLLIQAQGVISNLRGQSLAYSAQVQIVSEKWSCCQ